MKMGGLLSYFGTQTNVVNNPIIVGKGDSSDGVDNNIDGPKGNTTANGVDNNIDGPKGNTAANGVDRFPGLTGTVRDGYVDNDSAPNIFLGHDGYVEEPTITPYIPDLLDKIVKHSDARDEDGKLDILRVLDPVHIERVIAENK